jgi:hypothetical protein
MNNRVLVDTGPLVAIASARDQYHEICVEQLRSLKPPLLTCWPVLTEAAWLLRGDPAALRKLLLGFENGLLRLLPMDESSLPWIARFLTVYRKLQAQLANASLVFLAEREGIDTIFTLDRRDFQIYRIRGVKVFNLIPAL